jgi:hypothetical protein
MEATKRMVLVEKRILRVSNVNKIPVEGNPTDQVAKSKLNREMKNDLVDGDIPKDVKVKKYNQDLSRLLHTKRKIPIESVPIKSEKPITVDVQGSKPAQRKDKSSAAPRESDEAAKITSVKRSRGTLAIPSLLSARVARIERVRKTPKKFAWEEW